jgi:hypothetical protein
MERATTRRGLILFRRYPGMNPGHLPLMRPIGYSAPMTRKAALCSTQKTGISPAAVLYYLSSVETG